MGGSPEPNRVNLFIAIGLTALTAVAVLSINFAWTSLMGQIDPEPNIGKSFRPIFNSSELRAAHKSTFQPKELTAKPLFSPSRRPPVPVIAASEPPPAIAVAPEEPPPAYILAGLVVTSGMRKALLRRKNREAGVWLYQGDKTKEGWTVASIRSNHVTLVRGVRQIAVDLHPTKLVESQERTIARFSPVSEIFSPVVGRRRFQDLNDAQSIPRTSERGRL
jgi:hypothetical protein